jgi:hypothetical protein
MVLFGVSVQVIVWSWFWPLHGLSHTGSAVGVGVVLLIITC